MERRLTIAMFRCALVWVLMSAAAGVLAFFASQGEPLARCLWGMGFVLAGSFVGVRQVTTKPWDGVSVLVLIWAGGFGWWGPQLFQISDHVVREWLVGTGVVGPDWGVEFTQGLAIAAGSVITATLLQVATRSANVFAFAMTSTALAGCAPLTPWPDEFIIPLAAFVWHVLVAAGLAQWGMACVRRESRGRCPRCGSDIVGISSPVCPSCALPISNAVPYGATCELGEGGNMRPHGLG